YALSESEMQAVNRKLTAAGVQMIAYSVGSIGPDEMAGRKVFQFARSLNVEILVVGPGLDPRAVTVLDKLANEFSINVAIRGAVPQTLSVVKGSSNRIGISAE